jgi:hypothetical protein
MELLPDALKEYALSNDRETILEFRLLCETLATHITTLISQMERSACEDGYLRGAPNSYSAKQVHLQELSETYRRIFEFIRSDFDLERFKDGCHQVTYVYLHQTVSCQRRRACVSCGREHRESCGAITILAQIRFDYTGCMHCGFRRGAVDPFIGTASTWRTTRLNLWNASDRLHRFVWMQKEKVGRPKDLATWDLLRWAKTQALTIDALARTLVEADLDRNREGSIAVRVRTEKKRLGMLNKSVALWDKNETPYRRWNRIARSVGIKSPV